MKNLFGTDGIRNRVGLSPFISNELNILGKSIGKWLYNIYSNKKINVIIISDTRNSCNWVKLNLVSGLIEYDIDLYDFGIMPTPFAFHFLQDNLLYDLAIVISASHNQYYDNGIKIIKKDGIKLNLDDELNISNIYYSLVKDNKINNLKFGQFNNIKDSRYMYINKILSLFNNNLLKDLKIVVDNANGAFSLISSNVIRSLGGNVISINDDYDGFNINYNCGATNVENLRKTVLELDADFGLAFDGDGDRVILVNKLAEIKDGDDILAILSNNSDYISYKYIVGTVISNEGLNQYLSMQGKSLIRVDVGDKYIYNELKNRDLLLGGESSGHIILKNYINGSDGLLVALKVIEAARINGNMLLETFKKYPQINLSIPIKYIDRLSLENYIRSSTFQTIKEDYEKDGFRLLVRFSGTESVLRIMVEGLDYNKIKDIAKNLVSNIEKKLV